jgi:SOS-response transcriptional repressor LexA
MILTGNSQELVPQMRKAIACEKGFWLTVTGGSMVPALRHMQDSVFIAPLDRDAAKGDILLTQFGEHCLLHRVVRRDGAFLYYKGDARKTCEGPLPKCDVIGIVVQIRRKEKVLQVTPAYHFKCFLYKNILRAARVAKRAAKHFKNS